MMTGELNLTKCGNEIQINRGDSFTDIKIGNGIWLILNKEQVQSLKEELNKEAK